jgi:hypothetical protein
MPPEPRHIGDVLRERKIELATNDPVVRGGFTQVLARHRDRAALFP